MRRSARNVEPPAKVVDLDDYRPHLLIIDVEVPQLHILPVQHALNWASGDAPLPAPGILRAIIGEWLACVQAGCVAHATAEADDA